MAMGRGRLSDALVCGALVGHKHGSAFYRFFSRAWWSIDGLGLAVGRLIVDPLVPADGPILIAGDDTLQAKGGPTSSARGCIETP